MDRFIINGILWKLKFVNPSNLYLIDRTGELKLGTTDPATHTVYVANNLDRDLLNKVIIHELGHCVIVSYDLLNIIHEAVYPEYWIEAEEWVCNFVADYGFRIFSISQDILGNDAWVFIPKKGKLIA